MTKQRTKRTLNDKQKTFILENYLNLEYSEIANEIGVPRYTVVYFLKKQGLEGTKKRLTLTDEQQAILKRDYGLKTRNEFAKEFNVSIGAIATAVRELGLSGLKKKRSNMFRFTNEQDDYIRENYLTTKQEDMANFIGCSKGQVRTRIKKLGLSGYKRWNTENEKHLEKNWLKKTDEQLAFETGRTVQAIIAKRISMGLFRDNDLARNKEGYTTSSNVRIRTDVERGNYRWTDEEIQFVREYANEMGDDEIAKALNRSYRAVKHKRLAMKIHRTHTRSTYEIEIENFLRKNNVSFQSQFSIERYKFDFLIGKTLIEYNGDYFHCNPACFPNGPINHMQAYTVEKDKYKKSLALEKGYDYLVIWEKDFINNKKEILDMLLAVYEGDFVDDERAKSVEA